MTVRLGTRGSALALAQARLAADRIGGESALVVVSTAGDRSDRPLHALGEGVFVAALEDALRRGEIDVAVHSLKDLPTADAPGLVVAAVLEREDPRDAVITRGREGLSGVAPGMVVGTSSPRRAAFLAALVPGVVTRDIRGNVDTRLAKVAAGEYDATVLALAGLRRLGVDVGPDEVVDAATLPPAPGQGAIALQCRLADAGLLARLGALDHRATRVAVTAERAALRALGASCALAFGALGVPDDGGVSLDGALVTAGRVRRARTAGPDAAAVGAALARALGGAVHA